MGQFKVDERVCEREQPEYRLRGVVLHIGGSESGHYVSYVKEKKNWYLFDDQNVDRVTEEMVRSRCYGKASGYASGYILFY